MTGYRIRKLLSNLYEKHSYLLESEKLSKTEKACFERMKADMSEEDAALALYQLSDFLYRYYGKRKKGFNRIKIRKKICCLTVNSFSIDFLDLIYSFYKYFGEKLLTRFLGSAILCNEDVSTPFD